MYKVCRKRLIDKIIKKLKMGHSFPKLIFMNMKNRLSTTIFYLVLFLGIACSNNDDNENIIQGLEGTIMGTASCNTENNGLAYRIDVDDFESTDFIITATLPDDFKQVGLKIKFDMEPSNEGITICTTNYFPKQFYKISNVKIETDEN